MGDPIRVLLVDDQALLRSTFKLLLDASDGIEVVGQAGDGREAIAQARLTAPDVIVMDIRMPEMDGIEATARIVGDRQIQGSRILVLTTFETDEYVVEALRAGASGFLGKDAEPADLIRAIRTVAAGDELLSPTATRALIARVAGHSTRARRSIPGMEHLTDREREVMVMVAEGLSNDEIGLRLFISPATAKTHVNRAMMKVSARDRAQLVVFAYESGLVA